MTVSVDTDDVGVIAGKLISVADAARRDDDTDIPLGELLREAADTITRLNAERLSSPTEMREALAKATVISAYSISDPLAVRIVFGSDEDRAAFADAIDTVLSDG